MLKNVKKLIYINIFNKEINIEIYAITIKSKNSLTI